MQRSGDEAEVLLKIDDIAITLTVDVRRGFKRKKLSKVELADMDEDTRVRIEKILDGVKSNRDFDEPTNKDLSSMKHASTVGGAFRAGAVSTLLPGSYGALGCENASRVT